MKYELGEEVDDPFAAQSPASSKSNYTLGEEADDPFGEAPKKTRGFTGALRRGAEEALLNAGALISEVGKQTGYGGKVAPKALAKIAGMLHDPNYVSGAEDIMAPGASWGDRAAGVGRALVEGAPTLALGALGGAPGMAASAGIMGAGSGIRRVREADQVDPNASLSAGQLGRVGASAAIDAAGTLIPAGRALAPIKSAGGSSLPMALAKAGITGVKESAEAAGVSALSSVAQAAAQKPILEGQMASLPELAAAGAIGGAAAGGTRAFRMLPQMNEEISQSRFNAVDPTARARAANLLNDLTGNYKTLREGISEDVRVTAQAQARTDLDTIASAGRIGGKNLIEERLNSLVDEGNTGPAKAYQDAMSAIKKGEPVSPKYVSTLRETLSGDALGDAWLQQLDVASAIGELGNMGKASGTSRVGGLRATRLGEQLDRLSGYFGLGTVGSGIVGAVTGHPVATVGAGIGAGANLMNATVRGIDAFTGQSNPVGRFARRYADPTVEPVAAPTPTSTDARMALRVSKLAQSYDAARAREAAKAQKAEQAAEQARIKAEARQRDEQLANARRTLDIMKRSEGASASDAGLALRTAKLAQGFDQARARQELAASKAQEQAFQGQLRDDRYRLSLMRNSEGASATDAGLPLRVARLKSSLAAASENTPPTSAPAEAISNIVNNRPPNDSAPSPGNSVPSPVEPLVGPVRPPMAEAIAPEQRLVGSVSPMEDAMGASPGVFTRKLGAGQWDVTLDQGKFAPDKQVKNVDAWFKRAEDRILRREGFLSNVERALPENLRGRTADIMQTFASSGMGVETARKAFSGWVDSLGLPEKQAASIKDMFEKKGTGLNSRKHWNSE